MLKAAATTISQGTRGGAAGGGPRAGFGVRNSVSQMAIERLDGTYDTTNEVGQYRGHDDRMPAGHVG